MLIHDVLRQALVALPLTTAVVVVVARAFLRRTSRTRTLGSLLFLTTPQRREHPLPNVLIQITHLASQLDRSLNQPVAVVKLSCFAMAL